MAACRAGSLMDGGLQGLVPEAEAALDDLEARKRSLDGGRGVEILEIEEMPLQDDALLSAIARRLQEAGGAR